MDIFKLGFTVKAILFSGCFNKTIPIIILLKQYDFLCRQFYGMKIKHFYFYKEKPTYE